MRRSPRVLAASLHLRLILLLGLSLSGSWLAAQSADIESQKQAIKTLIDQGAVEVGIRKADEFVTATIARMPYGDGQIADLQVWLGNCYLELGRFQDAMRLTKLGYDHRKQFLPTEALPIAAIELQFAKIFLEAGEADPAEAHLLAARRLLTAQDTKSQALLVQTQQQLAGLCLMQGRLSESEHYYDTILVHQGAALGNQSISIAQTLNNIGGVYLAQGQTQKAAKVYESALSMQLKLLGDKAAELATTYTNLGVLHDQNGDFDLAEANLLKAYSIRSAQLPLVSPLVLGSLDNLVSFYLKRETYAQAEQLLLEALQLRERRLGADQPAIAEIHDRFATLYMARNQGAIAEQYWLKALQIRENSLGPQNEQVAANLYNLGKLENILAKNDQARIHLNWAMDIYENQTIGNEAQITAILSELFICDYMQGQIEAAERDLDLMYTLKEEIFGPNHPETLSVMEEQVKFYRGVEWNWKAEPLETELLKRQRIK